MTIFDEWEGRDPLDFTNRPKKSTKKQKSPPKSKKPFHQTPAGMAFGCLVWIVAICLIWSSCTKDDIEKTNIPETPKTSQKPGLKRRDMTEQDREIIGKCARIIKNLENIFLQFKNDDDFIEYGFAHPAYKDWQNKLENVRKILDKAHEGYIVAEYIDVSVAASHLDSISIAAAINRKNPNYQKEEREFLQAIDEELEPYLEWGTPEPEAKSLSPIEAARQAKIKKHAKNIYDLLTQYIYLTESPEFKIQRLKSKQYAHWMNDVKKGVKELNKDFAEDHGQEYEDFRKAYNEFKIMSEAFAKQKPNYDDQETKSFQIIKNCQKYQTL